MIRLISYVLVIVGIGTSVFAQTDPAQLARDAEIRLNAAHAALADAERASDRVTALSQTIHAYEDGLEALREGLRRAALREAAIRHEFDAESEKVSRFLGVLLSIQSSSGPLALLHPSGPLGTARSGMIVSEITPSIQKEAEALRARLEEVALLRALQESAAATLQRGLKGVQQARTDLSLAISNRTDLPQRFLADPAAIQSLINSTETLAGFASGLAGMDIGDTVTDPIRDFQTAKGSLDLPVLGTVLRRYKEPDAGGVAHPGLVLATAPQSLVTTPWPATLRFSGPLLDYENVVILEPDAGTLLILAGLETAFGEVGQVLPAGSAIGLMGGESPNSDSILQNAVSGASSERTETLYIELRVNADPVDPSDWFAQTKE